MHDPMLREIDAWRDKQTDKPGRAEAIRRLVEMGLQANRKIISNFAWAVSFW